MKRAIGVWGAILLLAAAAARADYTVAERGSWPDTWPKELEGLRGQSRTLEGPLQPLLHYAIPFDKREAFEAAWAHLVKVKSKGAPIVLRRGPSFWLRDGASAGVVVHTPPAGQAPIEDPTKIGGRVERTIYIELIVDGQIVDLNRIELPKDTPISDERFKNNSKP